MVNDKLVIYAFIDESGDGKWDRQAVLVADGPITSVDDFQVVDDGSGTFSPVTGLYITETDFIV